jgi:cytochrome P450
MTDVSVETVDTANLPKFPGARPARCPFDPPPEHAQWREQPGLQRATWNGCPVWVVSRHADARTMMTDPRISAEIRGKLLMAAYDGAEELPPIFPRMDGAEHQRRRRMLNDEFIAPRARAMRPEIERLANEFLDRMIEKGQPADLVRDYAMPVPSLVISLLLGVPYTDHEFFQEHSATAFKLDATPDEQMASNIALFTYMMELIERKEREPGDDLISRLIQQYVIPGELGADALAMNGMILLNAGHETTANMISLGVLALLQNPDALARIRDTDDPKQVSAAVHELLRYLSIVQGHVVRTAKEDMIIGGQQVRAGDGFILNIPGSNRDPARFVDPDKLDLDRDTSAHLAFGHGPHLCIGQTLARVELEVAYTVLLRRLPNLRLAVPFEQIKFRNNMATYGVHELQVAW